MDGGDRVIRRRKSLTERLGLKGIGCCGSTWGIMPATTFNVVDENDDVDVMSHHIPTLSEMLSGTTTCLAAGGSSRMNLAAALAAERHFRAEDYDNNNNEVNIHPGSRPGPYSPSSPLRPDVSGSRNVPTYDNNDEVNIHPGSRPGPDSNSSPLRSVERGLRNDVPTYDNNEVNIHSSSRPVPNSNSSSSRLDEGIPRNVAETPTRMSLMRLLEETKVYEGELFMEDEGSDSVCCVCMRRKKGAAFIPCGHTFCRVCSRELWVNRGCCPLCNRSILEILDIY